MTYGFQQTTLQINLDLITGINFDLLEYLYFQSKQFGSLRTKTSSDGISGGIIPHFGPYVASGILHDGAFRIDEVTKIAKLEQLIVDGTWFPLLLDEGDCNALIDEALRSEGCSWLERQIIYNALQLFGWKAFDDDRHSTNQPTPNDIAQLNKTIT